MNYSKAYPSYWIPILKSLWLREGKRGVRNPWYYGFAWHDYMMDRTYIMPIPINLIVHASRELWFWCIKYRPTNFDSRIARERSSAYLDGHNAGYSKGVVVGRQEAEEQFNKCGGDQ